jgi:2-dehydropantoate 2-reductase
VAFPTGLGMPIIAAIEAAGWSLTRLVADGLLELGVRGAREAMAIIARRVGPAPLGARLLLRAWLLRLGLWFAVRPGLLSGRRVVPFPLEPYLQRHFTKVGDQTRLILAGLVEDGKAAQVSTGALQEILGKLGKPDERVPRGRHLHGH